jgi:hypothetical protein
MCLWMNHFFSFCFCKFCLWCLFDLIFHDVDENRHHLQKYNRSLMSFAFEGSIFCNSSSLCFLDRVITGDDKCAESFECAQSDLIVPFKLSVRELRQIIRPQTEIF